MKKFLLIILSAIIITLIPTAFALNLPNYGTPSTGESQPTTVTYPNQYTLPDTKPAIINPSPIKPTKAKPATNYTPKSTSTDQASDTIPEGVSPKEADEAGQSVVSPMLSELTNIIVTLTAPSQDTGTEMKTYRLALPANSTIYKTTAAENTQTPILSIPPATDTVLFDLKNQKILVGSNETIDYSRIFETLTDDNVLPPITAELNSLTNEPLVTTFLVGSNNVSLAFPFRGEDIVFPINSELKINNGKLVLVQENGEYSLDIAPNELYLVLDTLAEGNPDVKINSVNLISPDGLVLNTPGNNSETMTATLVPEGTNSLQYNVSTEEPFKLFWLFKMKLNVNYTIDSAGIVTSDDKPWYTAIGKEFLTIGTGDNLGQ